MNAISEKEVLTPEQVADYLQVNRETVYRYIREGRLLASRLGRSYRIPRRNVDLLLSATRTRDDIVLREFSAEEIAHFLTTDQLDSQAAGIAAQFEHGSNQHATPR